jgi:hypothetical protein
MILRARNDIIDACALLSASPLSHPISKPIFPLLNCISSRLVFSLCFCCRVCAPLASIERPLIIGGGGAF